MASFTDVIPKFNPYIQQLPVEAMVAVGMEKQKRYDEGIQKIQQSVDNIAGLQVTRDVDKAYLQSKLNQIGSNMRTFAASDFSDFQLVNSVSGMVNQIAKDPNIQSAVSSTMKRQKEIEYMEEARKKGELTPQNELYFKKRDSEWANSTELGLGYNAKYINHFDHFKYAKEVFDAMKIDDLNFDEIYQKNADGSYVTDKSGNLVLSETMTRMKEEGYSTAKLEAAIDQIFSDPRVNQQLTIDAEYNYRNVSPQDLANYSTTQANQMKNMVEDKLDKLYIMLQADPNNEEIKKEIKLSEEAIVKIGEKLQESGQLISQNPEAAKAMLQKNKVKSNYTSMFNFTKKSTEILANPRWEAKFKIQKEANEHNRWAQDFAFKQQAHRETMAQKDRHKQMDLDVARMKALGKSGDGLFGPGGEGLRQSTETPLETIAFHDNKVFEAATDFNNAKNELIWSAKFDTDTEQGKKNREVLEKEQQKTGSREKAIENILKRTAKNKGKKYEDYILELNKSVIETYTVPETRGKLNKYLADALDNYERAEMNYKIQNDLDKKIKESNLAEFYKQMENVSFEEKRLTLGGETFTLTKQDAIDLALIAKYEDKSFMSKGFFTYKGVPLRTEEAQSLYELATSARNRLEKNGKSKLINSFLDNALLDKVTRNILKNRTTVPSELQGSSAIGEWMFGVRDSHNRQRTYFNNRSFDGVYDIFDNLDPSSLKSQVQNTAQAIRQFRYIEPNLIGEVSTGDTNIDNSRLATLRGIVSEYSRNTKAVGKNVKDFLEDIKGITKLEDFRAASISRGIEKDASGNSVPFLQSDNGKLYLNKEEASIFGIDPSTIHQNEYVSMVQSRINSQAGSSSVGSVDDVYTYRDNDVAMNNINFPSLTGTKYTAKVNFKQRGNIYYPYIYVNDGQRELIYSSPITSDNLAKLIMQDLPEFISPTTIEQLMIQKPK